MRNFLLLALLVVGSYNLTFAQCPPSTTPGIHIVQDQENLYRISLAYGVSMGDICKWNDMEVDDVLPLCKKLLVAAPIEVKTVVTQAEIVPKEYNDTNDEFFDKSGTESNGYNYKKQGKKHIVRPGETVEGLADLYGFTEKKFRSLNALNDNTKLTPGSVLITTDCSCEVLNEDIHTAKTPPAHHRSSTDHQPRVPSPNTIPVRPKIQHSPNKNLHSRSDEKLTTKGGGFAPAAPYMKQVEYSMLQEVNMLRSNPAAYIKYVEQYRKDQKRQGYPVPDATVDELITELRNSPALSQLQPAECVYNAARNHGQDIMRMGQASHTGSNGSQPWDRVKQYCPEFQDGNENLVGGPALVRESIILLLIDNGISSRGHRKTLLNPHWTHAGFYKIGQVGNMPNTWVQNFAQKSKSSFNQHHSSDTFTPKTGHQYASSGNFNSGPRLSSSASFMKSDENAMVREINLMRANPSGYIQYVEAYRAAKRAQPGYPVPEDAINELITELRSTKSLSVLKPSQCVYDAARNHGQDILRMGRTNHQGSDGSWPWDRVKRTCTSFEDGNENLVGGIDNVRDAVIMLLIDDGISSRGHRRSLMNPNWTHVACYKIGQVGNLPNCWVQQFGQE